MSPHIRIGLSLLALTLLLSAAFVWRSEPRVAVRPLTVSAPADALTAVTEDRPRQHLDLRTDKTASAKSAFGNLPMTFEENRGQVDEQVRFFTRGNGYTLFLTPSESVLSLRRSVAAPSPKPAERFGPHGFHEPAPPAPIETSVVRMKLSGSNTNARVSGVEELEQRSNYFIGNDPAKWRTNVPHFNRVKSEGVYPGIDLVYYSTDRQLEYDFVVAPGADANQICMKYEGAEQLEIDADGSLIVTTNGAEVRQHPPIVYQPRDGAREPITGRYVLRSANEVAFELGAYDASRTLVIDPVLVYSTYLGGNDYEEVRAIAVDSAGQVYVAGRSGSGDFPTTLGAYNTVNNGLIFMSKLNSSGTALVYSTFFGGHFTTGEAFSIALDSSQNAYITGYVSGNTNADFPVTAGAIQTQFLNPTGPQQTECFLTKLNSSGNTLLYSTYLGGGKGDAGMAIAVDSAGDAYLTGYTRSAGFPTTAGAFQTTYTGISNQYNCFVAKINPSGSGASDLVYCTYLEGSTTGYFSSGNAIAVDASKQAYICGETSYPDFPTLNALQANYGGGNADAFVAKLNSAGSALIYSTYLGGTSTDTAHGLAIDSTGNVYLAGSTNSQDFPVANPVQSTNAGNAAFAAKINASGNALSYSTYLGEGADGNGIAIDTTGNAYVIGTVASNNLVTKNAIQCANGGGQLNVDAMLFEIDMTGSQILQSTYLGGSGEDYGYAIALDSTGGIYVTGQTTSLDFTLVNSFQGSIGGSFIDGFIAKIDQEAPAAYSQHLSMRPNLNLSVTLAAADIQSANLSYSIVPPAHGSVSGTAPNITYTPNANFVGADTFTFKANDGSHDSNIATVIIDVINSAPVVNAQSIATHFGVANAITLTGSDADNDPFDFSILFQPDHGTLTGSPPNLTYTANVGYAGYDSFTFKATDGVADSTPKTVSISVTNSSPSIEMSASVLSIVPAAPVSFTATGVDAESDPLTFTWDFGDGRTSTDQNPAHAYAQVGVYTATVTVSDPAGAGASASVTIQVSKAPIVRVQTSDVVGFGGLPFTFDASTSTDPENAIASYDWDFGDGTPHGAGQVISKVYDLPGTYTVTLTITDSAGVSSSLQRIIEVLPGNEVGLFNGFMKYKVSWNRSVENKDSLSFEASVNVGDDVVGNGTAVALEIAGQRFTGTLDRKLRDTSDADQKWQVKAGIRKQPSGSVSLKVTIKKASLGLGFNQAGATAGADPHDLVSVSIPVHLEIGGHSFEMLVPTDFKFSGGGTRAKGDGESE